MLLVAMLLVAVVLVAMLLVAVVQPAQGCLQLAVSLERRTAGVMLSLVVVAVVIVVVS